MSGFQRFVTQSAAEASIGPIGKRDHPAGTAAVDQRDQMTRAMSSERESPVGANINRSPQCVLFFAAAHTEWLAELYGRFSRATPEHLRMSEPGEIPIWELTLEVDHMKPGFRNAAECRESPAPQIWQTVVQYTPEPRKITSARTFQQLAERKPIGFCDSVQPRTRSTHR
jgi:hypothetical protein